MIPAAEAAIRIGSILEVDRSHLPHAAKMLPVRRRFAGKVTVVERYDESPGWLFVFVDSEKAKTKIALAVPPVGEKHESGRGPKVRVIRH